MNTNYNIYTRNPVPNAPEFTKTMKTKRVRSDFEDESNLAKSVRKRLYGNAVDQTQTTKHLTLAQKQKLGRDQVLNALVDQPVKDKTILDILIDWSINDLGISETVTNQIFSNAVVTTESLPKKSVFKIRVKI